MLRAAVLAVFFFLLLPGVSSSWAKDVTFNFKNADIRAFIEFVAGFTGKNFLVDNRVKGTVTIISPTPIPEEQAYEVFQSVLELNGFATVPSGSVIKIVPRAESKHMALPLITKKGVEDDEMVTQVLRLRYADAQQLAALIRPLIPPNGHLVAYPRGNMLMITDSARNIERITRILSVMDRKDAVGVKLFTLKHASADKLAVTLNNLYGAQGAVQPGQSGHALKAFAHQPGNMLVVVGAPQLVNEIGAVVAKLDKAPRADQGRLQVRYLQHAKAADIAKVLSQLIGSASASGAAGPKGAGRPVFVSDIKVVADEATNALLITADPADMAALDRIIEKLDIRRRQVLIEALIVEVSSNTAQQFGIEWRGLKTLGKPGFRPFGGTTFGSQTGKTIGDIAADPFNPGNGLIVGVADGTVSFGGKTVLNIAGLARALEANGNSNILSMPNLLTMDNEEAEIIVGQNVPFITGQSQTQGGVANPFQTIERKDIGLTLRVKPQISEGDNVRLELYQEISSLAANPGVQGADLITNKRSVKTVVLARDSQMIVLGGLIRNDQTSSVQRVPCIGAVPLLGEPFKFTDNRQQKTNLMVFLVPHILSTGHDAEEITNEKYWDIRDRYETPVSGGTILFPRKQGTLPKLGAPARKPSPAKPSTKGTAKP
ncbi:MAG: type II secretion system protein GspD [Zetaproteobacteria bacterium]|nr:MAG: type II secretion system protein GspD [Zetaproteobacteria bacterium]